MKIKSIYISAFGALKNFELEFCDGFQVIYGENEAGKTTITEFIKSMFYGTGRRAAGQVISIREKYTPLDGTPAGGRVYFEHSGKEFCLERQFRKSDATDKITVTDMLSGKSEPAPSDIGKQLFGITMPAFERSVFISDTPGFSFDEAAAGEINQKLSNAALTDESVSYGKVLNRIDDARLKLISKSGKTGTLISDISRHNELIEALGESDSAARKKQELNEGIAEAKAKTEEIGARYEAAQKQLDNIKDIENAQKLKEYIELKEKLIEVTSLLTLPDGTVADEMFLKKFEFGFAKLESIKDKIQSGEKELAALEAAAAAREGNTPEQIREKLDKAKEELAASEDKISGCETAINALQGEIETLGGQAEAQKEKRKPVNIPLLIISIICLIASALTLHFVLGKPVITAAVGVFWLIIAALAFVFRPKDTGAFIKAREALDKKQNELAAKRNELMMISGEKNNIEAKIENLNISLNFGVNEQQKTEDTKRRIAEGKEQLEAEREKVRKFFGLGEDVDLDEVKNRCEALYEKADEQKQIKLRLSYLSRDLGGISYDEARQRLNASENRGEPANADELKANLKRLADEKSEAENLKTRLETELKTGFRGLRDPEDLRREISGLKEKIASKQAYYDALSAAYDVLGESITAARKSFGSALEKKTLQNFKEITGGAYEGVNISSDFDISAEKSGVFGMHSAEYLSRGTKDQAYLALRLAVAELITEKEKLPVILDDSLSQYDDKRFSAAVKFLKEYAADTQISLFTCHKYVKDEAEKQNIKTVSL